MDISPKLLNILILEFILRPSPISITPVISPSSFAALTELFVVLLEKFAEPDPLVSGVVDAVEAVLPRVELDEPGVVVDRQ